MMVPEKRLRQLAELGIALAALVEDRHALFMKATQEAREMTGGSYSSLGLVERGADPDDAWIHWLAADGKPLEEVKGRKQPVSEGLCGWVVRHGRSRRTGNVTGEADYFEQYAEMQSELDVPIKIGEQAVGVLSVESPVGRAFTVEHEQLMQIVAQFVAMALAAERD